MNLQESISYEGLRQPLKKVVTPKKRSAVRVAKRVFELAANGGFPYKYQSPKGWAKKWLSSPEFTLMEIDIHAAASLHINAIASPHPPKNPNRVEHYVHCSVDALDPIVVDLNKRSVGKSYLGYVPEVIVLDGKHRKMAQLQNGRTKILAWVGCKAAKRLAQYQKVARVVDAASENLFLPPVEPTRMASTYEMYASNLPAIQAGGVGSGRHAGQGDPRQFEPTRKEYKSYGHYNYHNKDGSFECKHCGENSFTNVDDMHKHLNDHHKDSVQDIHAEGTDPKDLSNPKNMESKRIRAELIKLMANRSNTTVPRVKELTRELKDRFSASGARSTGSLEEESASDDKIPPDTSDADTAVEASDQRKWNPNKSQPNAPGTKGWSSETIGYNPAAVAPGSGVGPRLKPNTGASRSEMSRVSASKDCDCGGSCEDCKEVNSGKVISKLYQKGKGKKVKKNGANR